MSILMQKIKLLLVLLAFMADSADAKRYEDKVYTSSPLVASLLNSLVGKLKPKIVHVTNTTTDMTSLKLTENFLQLGTKKYLFWSGTNAITVDKGSIFKDLGGLLSHQYAIDEDKNKPKGNNINYQYDPNYVTKVMLNIKHLLIEAYPNRSYRFNHNYDKWQRQLDRALRIAKNKISAKQGYAFYGDGEDLSYLARYFNLTGYQGWYETKPVKGGSCTFKPTVISGGINYADYIEGLVKDLKKCM